MQLTGFDEVMAKLQKLGTVTAHQAIKTASEQAGQFLVNAVQSHIHPNTGLLRSSIGMKGIAYQGGATFVTIVGPRTGFKDPQTGENPVHIAHLVEFGTRERFKKSGQPTGTMPAQPFLRPAWDSSKGAVSSIFVSQLWNTLQANP